MNLHNASNPVTDSLPLVVRLSRWTLLVGAPIAAFLLFRAGMGRYLRLYGDPLVPDWLHPIRADDVTHFVGAFMLTILLAMAWPLGRRRQALGAALAVLFVAALGPLIEWAQQLLGRGAEVGDFLSHEVGVVAATLGLLICRAKVNQQQGTRRDPNDPLAEKGTGNAIDR